MYNWPLPDTQAICLTQSRTGSGALIVNGFLTINDVQPGNAIFPGITRTVSLKSVNNLSAINVTINGTLNGAPQSETRAGPNNNTVETTKIFDSVTSVTTSGTVTAMSVGSGTKGRTHWFKFDYNRHISAVAVQAVIAGTIDYTLNLTLDDVQTNASPTVFAPIMAFTGATTNQFASLGITSFNYANLTINSSGTDGALVGTLLQTGIS